MVQVTISSLTPSTPPTNGWIVSYRVKGTTGAFIAATGSPFSALPIVFTTTDPAGTLYEVSVQRDCAFNKSTVFILTTPCTCVGSGYTPNVSGDGCKKVTTIGATVTNSGYCLAIATNAAYSQFGSRIYNLGFSLSTLLLPPSTPNAFIFGSMTANPQWANPAGSTTAGAMNREGVWIDSDCDGNKNSLSAGLQTTIAAEFNNAGVARVIFVGIGADNQFKLVVNGNIIVDTGSTFDDKQFKFWHIIPVPIVTGINYINAVATGDGTINDSIAMVVYDNTAAQIKAATSDSQLNILFKSSTLRGGTYDVATCPAGYSLDVSGGSGSYVCTKVETKVCNSAS